VFYLHTETGSRGQQWLEIGWLFGPNNIQQVVVVDICEYKGRSEAAIIYRPGRLTDYDEMTRVARLARRLGRHQQDELTGHVRDWLLQQGIDACDACAEAIRLAFVLDDQRQAEVETYYLQQWIVDRHRPAPATQNALS
jgi:hypothetical protein